MSDKVPLGLDVDSLTEALDHLHLATDSLSRALSSAEPCPSEEWIVVQDDALRESPPAPLRALIPNPPLVLVTLLLGLGLGPLTLAPLGSSLPRTACSSLSVSCRADRARRAFSAGQSAALVLSGERACPDPTPAISVRNRCYVVLRHHSGAPPAFYLSFASFKGKQGRGNRGVSLGRRAALLTSPWASSESEAFGEASSRLLSRRRPLGLRRRPVLMPPAVGIGSHRSP